MTAAMEHQSPQDDRNGVLFRRPSMLRSRLLAPALILGAAAVVAAGCGSSGAKTSTSAAPTTPAAAAPAAAAGQPTAGTSVTAKLTEYHIALSQSTFAPGPYTFVADNAGATVHALKVIGPGVNQGTRDLQPGQSAQMTVTLQAGTYDVLCPVPGHQALGMDLHITVGTGAASSPAPTPAPMTTQAPMTTHPGAQRPPAPAPTSPKPATSSKVVRALATRSSSDSAPSPRAARRAPRLVAWQARLPNRWRRPRSPSTPRRSSQTRDVAETPAGGATRPRPLIDRRRLEIALGILWLLDGLLQFQPYMFTSAFFDNLLGMANMGLPGPVSSVDFHVATLLGAHPVAWNSIFASVQVGLGVGLIWRRTADLARGASILWAIGVWVVGEGFGGVFMPGTSFLTGAPGAALLYALAGLLLWPRRDDARPDGRLLGDRWASGLWVGLWTATALLELEGVNHAAGVPAAQLANIGEGEPGPIAGLNHAVGHLFAGRGAAFAVILGAAQLLIGWGALSRSSRRAALLAGIGLAASVGLLGQDLGAIATGRGTDPGIGPPLVLVALILWPSIDRRRPEPTAVAAAAPQDLLPAA